MIVAVGGSVHVQVSSITWVQHVSLTSWTYIYNLSLMIFSPNLAIFHSKPLWSVICILAPTGWKLFGWHFFPLSRSLASFLHLLTHPFTVPGACKLILPSPTLWLPPSPLTRCLRSPFNISCAPERNKQISWRGGGCAFQSWICPLGLKPGPAELFPL